MLKAKKQHTAIVVFVKTPGYSPVKTRLAKSIGKKNAEIFYKLSFAAIAEVVENFSMTKDILVKPFWAVAEEEALASPYWKEFEKVYQGEGSLGERLAQVYEKMKNCFSQIIFIGADAPQISPELLQSSLNLIKTKKSFVLGPAVDGGFWLWGGSYGEMNPELWKGVAYSHEKTFLQLRSELEKIAPVSEIETLEDIDEVENLEALRDYFSKQKKLLPAQQELYLYLKVNKFGCVED